MVNHYAKGNAGIPDVRPDLATTRRIFRGGVENSRHALEGSYLKLKEAEMNIKNFPGEVPETLFKDHRAAARQFNNDVTRLGRSHGKLGASLKDMFKSFADTLGINTSNWSSTKIKGSAEEAWMEATKIKGNYLERALSKPFRIAGNFPKISMVVGGLFAVAGIGSAMHKRAEHRTQEDAMQQAALIEAQMQARQGQVPMAQATTVYVPQQPQPAEMAFPASTAPMIGSSTITAGNDNIQHQGTVAASQQRLAGL